MANVGGYDFDLVVVSLAEGVQCSICALILKDAVEIPCFHSFCRVCWNKWKASQIEEENPVTCPLCNTVHNRTVNGIYVGTIDRFIRTTLDVYCKQHNLGCDWIGKIDDFQHHIPTCPCLEVDCEHFWCSETLLRRELEEHLEICEYRIVTCEWCEDDGVVFNELDDHYEECDFYPVECPNDGCGEVFHRISKESLEEHVQEICDFEEIACEFADVGCTEKILRNEMNEHCEEFTQKHLRMMMKELSQVKIEADGKDQRLKEVNAKLKEVILDAAEKEQQLNKVNEELSKLETRLNKQIDEKVNLDEIDKRMGEVAERCFGFIKLLSKVFCNENNVQIEGEEEMNEFVSSVVALKRDGKEKEKKIDTCFKIFDKEYSFSEIDALVKRLPLVIEKNYSEKFMDLFNSMEDNRFYEFGDKEIYVKVNLQEYSIRKNFCVYYRYFSKITPSNDHYCVYNNETVSFKTGNCYSELYLYDHNDKIKEEEKIWLYNNLNGNNKIPSEKDITELQFVNINKNDRKIIAMERSEICKGYYYTAHFLFSESELPQYIFKDAENDQYLLLCLKGNKPLTNENVNEQLQSKLLNSDEKI